eukprot:6206933-Pleurochrysis_carterae.AAC.2
MHEFLIRKDDKGVVRILFRKSSQASTWIPEGLGYEVFKSIPEGLPPLAALKPDQSWERYNVESAVRKWLPHFTLPTEEAFNAAKDEWNRRLWRIPTNMQAKDLLEEQKLVWPTFPQRHESAASTSTTRSAQNVSERLENPPVNPITGPGRTSAMVRTDAMAYQKLVHAAAKNSGGPEGIFQGNYLLVQLPADTGLTLHRVAHGIFYQDATEQDATFTTLEYTHTPAPTQPDLWGTFTPRLNTNYNPANVRSGTKFVRHSSLSRSEVVMYNVKMLQQPLRIAASALEQLASIRPAQYPFPASIPTSHRQPEAGSGASLSSSSSQLQTSQQTQQQTSQQSSQQQTSQQPSHPRR